MTRLLAVVLAPMFFSMACAAEPEARYDAAAFSTCAACHLATGEGIPGAFPGIHGRASKIAALDGGRQYLISVVAFGLMGPLSANGTDYSGFMPGQQGSMNAEAMAAALNYLVFELTDEKPANAAAFSGDEVAATAKEFQDSASPMTAASLRTSLIEQHGDAWPD